MMPERERAPREVSADVAELESELAGYVAPAAFAVGIATVGPSGAVLDVSYPHVNLDESWAAAAVLAAATRYRSGTETYRLDQHTLDDALAGLDTLASGDGPHPDLEAWRLCGLAATREPLGGTHTVVACFLDNLYQPPVDAIDAYLRLHLLSHRKVRPNTINLNGIFSVLNNAVWTNHGPFEPEGFEMRRIALRAEGYDVEVKLVDKFPRMLDYVVPTGVRIADSNRVRLGAHLAEGTTVMHEGFCNFNAGTLGVAMVEGRISQGVVVGDHSDIGGGASIMGTLSGGGTEVVSIGENCLLGANAGIGISLGDNCIVEAGLYVTAGSRVRLPDGTVVKARDLSGRSGILFRRDSQTGAIDALPNGDNPNWGGLNAALHA